MGSLTRGLRQGGAGLGTPVLVGITLCLAATATLASWHGPVGASFLFWCVACFAGELLWVRMPVGRVTVSMASCFQFAALLLLPRGQAMLAAIVTGLLAEGVVLRKPPVRTLFNAAQAALAVGAASWMVHATMGPAADSVRGLELMPLLGGGIVYFVLNTGFVSLAVAFNEGLTPLTAWRKNFGGRYELLSNGALFSLGALIAGQYTASGPKGVALVVLPLVVAFEAYKAVVRAKSGPETEAVSKAGDPTRRAA